MKLFATLFVRDEADVIEENLQHHFAQGVDFIIATDNGSVDGTRDILEEYAGLGLVELHDEPIQDYRQSRIVTFMARRAARLGGDWVLNLDADEFWVPRERPRKLADVLENIPPHIGRIKARRTDLEGFAGNEHLPWQKRLVWRNMRTVSENGKPLLPKMCHRADAEVYVSQGNHWAEGPILGEASPSWPLDIYHVPRRTWQQFHTKIANGGSAYAANQNLPENMGWQLRQDHQRLLNGELESIYRQRCLSLPRLAWGLVTGRYRRDSWLKKRLATLRDESSRLSDRFLDLSDAGMADSSNHKQ